MKSLAPVDSRHVPWLGLLVLVLAPALASAEFRRLRSDPPEGHASSLRPAEPAAASVSLGALSKVTGVLRLATDELLHFLEAALPPYEDFLPACMSHVKKVVQGIDRSYTDLQLQTVLEHECSRDEQFMTVESGLKEREVCMEFAEQLASARMKELDSGSTEGYAAFCQDYYKHKGGVMTQLPKESPKDNATEAEIREKTYEEHISKGQSHERATFEAQKAVEENNEAKASGRKRKDEFPVWAAALIIGGIVAFVLTGLYLHYRT
uniref:Uncharacterized protein n=1 Tax=Alexandrium monilatum TaxID=311494 RepID=A0A7S4USN1_9DINO|mmetsp:Transcript_81585/g.243265  ORF Transcript_81585/g.243265 Transcript_81585/m.243265 type:complete len:265 (-) Transcript_81585:54-848(-)